MTPLRTLMAVAILAGAVALTPGCSSQDQSQPPPATAAESQPQAQPAAAPASDSSSEPDSVLGATAHAVGTIILLPFRIVANVVGLIL